MENIKKCVPVEFSSFFQICNLLFIFFFDFGQLQSGIPDQRFFKLRWDLDFFPICIGYILPYNVFCNFSKSLFRDDLEYKFDLPALFLKSFSAGGDMDGSIQINFSHRHETYA